MLRVMLFMAIAGSTVSMAQDEPARTPPTPPPAIEGAAEEVIVYGDLFARWDGTRWAIYTELLLPYSIGLVADENESIWTSALQVHMVLACDKDWKLTNKRYEVSCAFEDVAIQSAVARNKKTGEREIERGQRIIDEIDAKLTGASVQLQVLDDGRVANVDIEGITARTRRQSKMQETLRVIVERVMSGFHLKLRKFSQLNEGKWLEHNSTLMSMPAPVGITPAGSSMVMHYLNQFDGHTLVQSIGKALISVDMDTTGNYQKNYDLDLIGVSIFDKEEGYMTERVWAVDGKVTAGALFDDGGFWFAGRIEMLDQDERPALPATIMINRKGESVPGLAPWVSIER